MDPVISVKGMCTGYAGQPVVHDLSFDVMPGEVLCLLGPNGAGKTTTMLALAGELPLIDGEVEFGGVKKNAPLYKRARNGMSYVTEERSVFKGMTLRDNLKIGDVSIDEAIALFPELGKRMNVRGGLLSGGEQQMLTLARALGRKPRLLLADELSLGLAPLVVDRLLQAVRRAADEQGTAVIMVEQHAHKALNYTDHAIVMRRGRVGLDLTGADARTRIGEVEQAYLTASGGNVAAGEADLAARHAGSPGANNSAG
jgi:branched-chain amino acid transport system ATP-binding protein